MRVSFLLVGLLIQIVLIPTAILAEVERTTQNRDGTAGFICKSDNDCLNQGVCNTTFGTCSCFSGFGNSANNYDCSVKPDLSCSNSYQTPSSTSNSFSPSLSFNLANNYLSVSVIAALDNNEYVNPWTGSSSVLRNSSLVYSMETIIEFAGSQYCNYPPPSTSTPPWTKYAASGSSCSDSYSLEMLWSQARDNCGFVYSAETSAWTANVKVSRKYLVPFNTQSDKRDKIERIESATFVLNVNFPTVVNATTSDNAVTVSGPSTVFASALALVEYNSAGYWRLKLETFTNRPYQLSNPVASTSDAAIISRFSASASQLTNISACNSNLQGCSQEATFFFTNCSALQGNFVVIFTPICNAGDSLQTCAHPTSTVAVTVKLNTGSACPLADTVQIQQKSLTVYRNSNMSVAASNFTASGIAFFGALVTSTDTIIYNRTLKSVCLILNPTSGNVNCLNVEFNLLNSTSLNDPSFSINLAQTRALTNLTTPQSFRVVAIIGLIWSTSGKRDLETAETDATADLYVLPESEPSKTPDSTSSSSGAATSSSIEQPEKDPSNNTVLTEAEQKNARLKMALVASMAGFCGLLIIIVVLVIFIAHKRKQGQRAAEARFNFSDVS